MVESLSLLTERIIESVRAGLMEYQCRHGGNQPEMIVMSYNAFVRLRSKYIKYSSSLTMFDIPVHVTEEQGIKVRFCEPSIHIYSANEANTIKREY